MYITTLSSRFAGTGFLPNKKIVLFVLLGLAVLMASDHATAASTICTTPIAPATETTPARYAEGCELMPLYNKIENFLGGIFLKIAGLVAVVVGIAVGMAKSSIQPAAMGIGFGVVMLAMPAVVKNFFSAII